MNKFRSTVVCVTIVERIDTIHEFLFRMQAPKIVVEFECKLCRFVEFSNQDSVWSVGSER